MGHIMGHISRWINERRDQSSFQRLETISTLLAFMGSDLTLGMDDRAIGTPAAFHRTLHEHIVHRTMIDLAFDV